jgi:hypothetical protein
MIKLLSIDEIGKQDYLKRQQGKQPEKTSEGILGLKSKLPLGVIIGSMLSLDLAFILLILS